MKLGRRDIRELVIAASATWRAGSGWRRGPCPVCERVHGRASTSSDDAMGLSDRGYFQCFRCGTTGWVRDRDETAPEPEPEPAEPVAAIEPPPGFIELADGEGATAYALSDARAYLAGRGITRATARAAGIGACLYGYFGGRVIVPFVGDSGQWLGFVARAWSKAVQPKYRYPKGMNRRATLYRAAVLARETDEPAIVVEGAFDALPFEGGVALLGKPAEAHIDVLARARRPIAVVLDGDAWEEGEALAQRLLLRGQRAGFIRLPPKVDPDEVPPDELMAQARACLSGVGHGR